MDFTLENGSARLCCTAETGKFVLQCNGETWNFDDADVALTDGVEKTVALQEMQLTDTQRITNALSDNLILHYRSDKIGITFTYRLYPDYLDVSALVVGDEYAPKGRLYFPTLRFGEAAEDRWTILPKMQGLLIPAGSPRPVKNWDGGMVFSRDAYLPFFAYTKANSSLVAIWHTPYDGAYEVDHPGFSHTQIRPCFVTSLGYFHQRRTMRYLFVKGTGVMDVANAYRTYADEYGHVRTLKEKEAINPNIARLYGAPVVHAGLYRDVVPDSPQYDAEHPENNRFCVTFDESAAQLEELYRKGVRGAYLHFDGWNHAGYDNQVPDMFPPAEPCGGVEGMRRLGKTAQRLGYVFGIHDQYRDMYFSAPSYHDSFRLENADHTHPFINGWDGGKQTLCCSENAIGFVKRNYSLLEQADIPVEAAYLDVFSAIVMDECVDPLHTVTREECAVNRRACLEYLNHKGIITSSEEAEEPMLPSIALCHHAPFLVDGDPFFPGGDGQNMGVAIPLTALVYHDCLVMPWPGLDGKSDWGMIDVRDDPVAWAAITGNPIYYKIDETAENIAKGVPLLELHRRVATQKIVDFGFERDNMRCQYSVFEDGTRVHVDHDAGTYEIDYPKA